MTKNYKIASPILIMIMGLPGSGKTYFAKAFARKIGGTHFNSDIIRKQLDPHPAYTRTTKSAVYETMFQKVCQALEAQKIVVVDATFSLQRYRDPYIKFVQARRIPLKVMVTVAGENTIFQRLQQQRPDSDADYQVYQKIKSEFEPINMESMSLNSDRHPLEELIEQGLAFIRN